jgi:hypothetical protein
MNNSDTIAYIEEFLNIGHHGLSNKSKRYENLGNLALILAGVTPILLFIALLSFTNLSVIRTIILSIFSIPILIFIAFVAYFFSGLAPLALKDDVINESLIYYKGVQNLRPSIIWGLNSEIINKKFEKYMQRKNLSKGEREIFDQLALENYQGTIEQLIIISKNINKN